MANKWGKNGNRTDFVLLGSKITADSDCSHEIKPTLLAGPPIPLLLVGLLGIPHNCAFSGELFSADKSWMALRPWLMTGRQGVTQGQSLCLKVAVVPVMPISLLWDQAEGSCQAETPFLPALF